MIALTLSKKKKKKEYRVWTKKRTQKYHFQFNMLLASLLCVYITDQSKKNNNIWNQGSLIWQKQEI